VYLDYYDKLDIKKSTVSDLLSKQIANHIKAMEPCEWFVGRSGYKSEVVLPFTRKMFFKVHEFELTESYHITYMYGHQVAYNSLYSTTYGPEALEEINVLIPNYVQVNYKDLISTDGCIDHIKLNQ
jgi:hypothetical protein